MKKRVRAAAIFRVGFISSGSRAQEQDEGLPARSSGRCNHG